MSEDRITQIQKTLVAMDGSQARLTVYLASGSGLASSVGVYGHHRSDTSQPWALCNDRPYPGWEKMSGADYEKFGRSELLRTIKQSDIIKYAGMLGQPLASVRDRLEGAQVLLEDGSQQTVTLGQIANQQSDGDFEKPASQSERHDICPRG